MLEEKDPFVTCTWGDDGGKVERWVVDADLQNILVMNLEGTPEQLRISPPNLGSM